MTGSLTQLLWFCPLLVLLQVLAALPWVAVLDSALLRQRWRDPQTWLQLALAILGLGVAAAFLLHTSSDPTVLASWGRRYAAVLQLQLLADLVVVLFLAGLQLWPKGGAVALAAFREGVRQPMFWLLGGAGVLLLLFSPFLPYFTFGEDLKMLKDLGYITIMFAGALFGVLAASMSISEEIEGRTAVTVMSKPISRRHFLLGKFLGILGVCFLLTVLLGWLLVWIIQFKQWWDPPIGEAPPADPSWVLSTTQQLFTLGPAADLLRGTLLWVDEFGEATPGLVISFCQVMILLAVAVALATRVPMIVNAMLCLSIYFLGHLTPVLTAVSQNQYPLIRFVAQVFDYALPGLDMFDMGPAVVRYAPLPPAEFALYTVNVAVYAVIYTAIALLFGLILFEDRDLA